MSQGSGVESRLCVEWKNWNPISTNVWESPDISVSGSKWFFEMCYISSINMCYIYLAKVMKDRLIKPFRVTTFIEVEEGMPILPNVTVVKSTNHRIWPQRGETISECLPEFDFRTEFKVVCIFHGVPLPSAQQSKDETVNLPTNAGFNRSSFFSPLYRSRNFPKGNVPSKTVSCSPPNSGNNSRNLPKDKLSSDKCVQACLELSPDLESLSFDLCNLLERKAIADVKLRCGGRNFSAHRAVLAARSEVFAAMFRNETLEGETGIVDVIDLDASALELFLKYMYSGRVPNLSDDTLLGLYATSDKYAVHALKKTCSESIVRRLTEENCLSFLTLADVHSDQDLKDAVVNFVVRHMEVLRSQEWTRFKKEHPMLAIDVYDIVVNRRCFNATASK